MDADWKSIVRVVAPTIASVFGTPLAGMGVTALLNVLLPSDTASPVDPEAYLKQALSVANPDLLLKIKQADAQFSLDMKKLDVDLETVRASDRSSARGREIALHDRTPAVLAFCVCTGFFGILSAMLTMNIPDSGHDALLVMLGALGGAFGAVVSYYFGSSAGSTAKSETIKQLKGAV